MNGHRVRVPIALCQADDLHFLQRGLIPLDQYIQDILDCWNAKSRVDRLLLERTILKEVKVSGLLKGVHRIYSLRRMLLKHKRRAFGGKMLASKYRVKKARKIKHETARLDPTVKVLAIIGGAIVSCKGHNFRRRYAYRECTDDSAGIFDLVPLPEQPLAHDAEKDALANKLPTLCEDHSSNSVRDTLKVLNRDDRSGGFHAMPNVI